MLFTYFAATLALAAVASAQNQAVTVNVGAEQTSQGGIFQFIPSQITASNDPITQSSFADPCQPMAGGFDSGWVYIMQNLTTLPEWNLTITNDQTPIWFYCKQLLPSPHCNAGMVGVINVKPGANSFSAFQAKAQGATSALPGQQEGGFVGIGASASAAPVVPSGATLFNPSASATAPPAGASSAAPSESAKPGSATTTGVSLFSVLLAALCGTAMVL
ncbi:hypothetical protein B0H10DRAFT_2078213 [Mycena sp. CBHHK59/15]|nr:hypothetical protein B0H10DRAFT_2078213 [Mycena sp. CBHHK59/15]